MMITPAKVITLCLFVQDQPLSQLKHVSITAAVLTSSDI